MNERRFGEEREFDAAAAAEEIAVWIRDWFEENGRGCSAVVGISGGKDSSVAAALCRGALGKERVIGVLMPDGEQPDIEDAQMLTEFLGIRSLTVNVGDACSSILREIEREAGPASAQTKINLPARVRMAALYAVSQTLKGRVANTCNLSEDWVGYSTRYGDGAGDFSPLGGLTVGEVKQVGRALGLPGNLVEKRPSDGLSGRSDEDNLGFTYRVLDRYIRTGYCDDPEVKERIDRLHRDNLFKLKKMPVFRLRQRQNNSKLFV